MSKIHTNFLLNSCSLLIIEGHENCSVKILNNLFRKKSVTVLMNYQTPEKKFKNQVY